MATLSLPLFSVSLSFSSSKKLQKWRSCCSSSARLSERECNGTAVLWFKHDLRVDDHPALVEAASSHRELLPLYIFDRRILSRFSDEVLELALYAVEDLRKSLQKRGSNLMIKLGNAEDIIKELVTEVKATHIYVEEEVEYSLCRMLNVVKKNLQTIDFGEASPKLAMWKTPFYDIKNPKDLPDSHGDFEKLNCAVTIPVMTPPLPKARLNLEWGPLPTFHDLKEFIYRGETRNSWVSLKYTSAEAMLQKKLQKSRESNQRMLDPKYPGVKRTEKSVFVTSEGNVVGGGTDVVLNALAGYLRYLEGTARDDWQEVHQKLRTAEDRDGASFIKLFGPVLCLGIISRRRVHFEAIKYEKERNAGFLSPFGYSAATVAAAVDAIQSMEWYWLIALQSQMTQQSGYSIRIWRWNGFLVQYTTVGREGPAILLVHGFGAFLEHYRDNINEIADGGNCVWAVTMIGFGRSEKPNLFYTENLWAEMLRDFVIDVIGEPVHLVGNSIGGYVVAIVSCLWPALVKSVILINSGGDVVPGYTYLPIAKDRQSSGVTWVGARLLLFYLRSRIKEFVKSCYPTKMERADDWLISEMLRASYDPGVLVLLESVFSFNLSIPLNYLLEGFEGKVFVIQGMKDPISNSKLKVGMFQEHLHGVAIQELDAGHCPHDELPEEVNTIICEWTVTVDSKVPTGSIS